MTESDLEKRIRESASLLERLDQCHSRIGAMRSDRRPPSMTIPVQWYDDDIFIVTTLKDAIEALQQKGAVS